MSNLNGHKKSKHITPVYHCDTCEYKFTKVDELNQHKKTKHEIDARLVNL